MRNILCCALLLALFAVPATAEDLNMQDQKVRRSYSLGFQFGEKLKSQGISVDPESLAKGVADAGVGLGALMTREEMQAAVFSLQQELIERQEKQMAKMSQANIAMGEEFLSRNKKKAGVVETASGLQYEVVKKGTGKKPSATDTVVVHYRGTLLDGTEFDSSYQRKQPATFPVNGVIQGWQEALQLMSEGAKYKLAIPANLAYGERGAPPYITPNSTLLFEVELLEVK